MYVLRFKHTRTGKPTVRYCATWGGAMLRIMMIRQVKPGHPITINGKRV